MPYNGSGVFSPLSPQYPAISGTVITASDYNAILLDIATSGFGNCLTRDGQGKPSADINWNGKGLANVGTFGAVDGAFSNSLSTKDLTVTGTLTFTSITFAPNGVFNSTVEAVSNGVIGNGAITGGAGGTNGSFVGTVTGGGGTGAGFQFLVAGNALTQIIWLSKGINYTSAPTLGFAASAGLAGASATAIIGTNTPDGALANVYEPSLTAQDTYKYITNGLVLQTVTPIGAGLLVIQKQALENASTTPWPSAPTIYINPVDAQFNLNALIPNRMTATPTRDFFQFESAITARAGGTLTRNFAADPWGGTTANRAQLTAGGGITLCPISSAAPSEAGSYRIGFLAKSNTGAGAQSFKVNKNLAGGTVISTVEGSWTTVNLAFSGLVNNDFLAMGYDAANADILFTKPVITQYEVSGNLQYVPAIGGLSHQNLAVPGSMTIQNASLVGPYSGALKHSSNGVTTTAYSAMTMLALVKKDAASVPSGGFALAYTDGASVAFGEQTNAISWIIPGLSGGVTNNAGMILDNAGYVLLGLKWDATHSEAWVNGVKVRSAITPTNAAINTTIGYYGGNQAGVLNGHFGPLVLFNTYLSDVAMAQACIAMEEKFNVYGDVLGRQDFLIIMGDSISAEPPTGATLSYASKAAAAAGCFYLNYAVAGSTIANLIASQYPSALARVQEAVRAGRNPIVSIMIGTNSILTAPSTLQSYINNLVAAGGQVILCTIPSSGLNSSTNTNTFNTNARLLTSCTICDVAANAFIGGNTAYTNTTYFNAYPADPVPHPNQTGQDLMQTIFQPVLAGLMV